MWLILQHEKPDDFVVGTGESHSVREFIEEAFSYAGVEIEWKGKGEEEKGIVKSVVKKYEHILKPGKVIIQIDRKYFRPTEVEFLQADYSKAKRILGWEPRTTFKELVMIMVDYDMMLFGLEPPGKGIEINRKKNFSYTDHKLSLLSRE